MQKWIYSCIAILCIALRVQAEGTYAVNAANYIEKYKLMAIAEQQRSGVPAAITLGQGILETQAGCSVLVSGANNHFGIKCKKEWTGETFSHTDDAPDECFRKYKCADDSYKDHSDYLRGAPRYAALFKLPVTDYTAWAYGLKKCGYATNPKYAQQLIKIIEDFGLQQYTLAALNNEPDKPLVASAHNETGSGSFDQIKAAADEARGALEPNNDKVKVTPDNDATTENTKGKVLTVNGLKAIYGFKGDMLLQYAMKHKIRYAHLLEMNDLPDAPLPYNMYIYLQKKNLKGTHETHIVKPGETLLQVAQLEGIQMKRLAALNNLGANEEPIIGSVLQLQQYAGDKPGVTTLQTAAVTDIAKQQVRTDNDYIKTNNGNNTQAEIKQESKVEIKETAAVYTAKQTQQQPIAVNQEAHKSVREAWIADSMAHPEDYKPEVNTAAANQPKQENAQDDDLARLKSQLDKVVYTGNSKPKATAGNNAKTATAPAQQEPVEAGASTAAKYYTVQKGDTAFSIAKRNNITMHQLMDMNKLDFDELKVGQRLRVK